MVSDTAENARLSIEYGFISKKWFTDRSHRNGFWHIYVPVCIYVRSMWNSKISVLKKYF